MGCCKGPVNLFLDFFLTFYLIGVCRPSNSKELFNLRHSQARNCIERIFGVVKKRFKMMRYGSEYPINVQARAVPAMCALHNFIRIHDPDEDIESWEDSSYEHSASSSPEAAGALTQGVSNAEMRRANKRGMTLPKQCGQIIFRDAGEIRKLCI